MGYKGRPFPRKFQVMNTVFIDGSGPGSVYGGAISWSPIMPFTAMSSKSPADPMASDVDWTTGKRRSFLLGERKTRATSTVTGEIMASCQFTSVSIK